MKNKDSKLAHPVDKKIRITAAIVAVVICACIFYASSIPGSGLPSGLGFWTTVAHFIEYSCLGAALAIALSGKNRKFWIVVLIAVLICSIYGASDELHQWFVPGRSTDIFDWLTDTAGGFFGSFVALKIALLLGRSKR